MLRAILQGETPRDVAMATAKRLGLPLDVSRPVPVVACYIDQNFASLLLLLAKHGNNFSECLLANANAGGENVHRGLVLGALVGAHVGASSIPAELKSNLFNAAAIDKEIDEFVAMRVREASSCM